MEKKLEDFTVIELKSIAYDCLAQIQAVQAQLAQVNAEITKKSQVNEPKKETIVSGKGK